jgi:hypothetical protein
MAANTFGHMCFEWSKQRVFPSRMVTLLVLMVVSGAQAAGRPNSFA